MRKAPGNESGAFLSGGYIPEWGCALGSYFIHLLTWIPHHEGLVL